jgi:copper chaperone
MAKQVSILNVEGMSCAHCEARIKKVVGALGGMGSVAVDLKGKTVSVEFDPGMVTGQKIKDAIEEQGYDVL